MELKPNASESKLLILYLFNEVRMDLNDLQVLRAFVELDIMNYFDLMNYIAELTAGEMLAEKELPAGKYLSITEKGKDVLAEFVQDIRNSQRERIVEYCASHKHELRSESLYTGEYQAVGSGYHVLLKIMDGSEAVFQMELKVFSKDDAMHAIESWRKNAPKIYTTVLDKLK
ncbi:MAG: DUF4364 family protein [Eubacteriales bacterium]